MNEGVAEEIKVKWDPDADVPRLAKDLDAQSRRIPLDKESTSDEQLVTFLKAIIASTGNMHCHTHTCEKGNRKGDHSDCRMGYDRPLVNISHVSKSEDGHPVLLQRRSHGMLVPFIPALMLACPSNHVMNLTCDSSRWRRDVMLYMDAIASGDPVAAMTIKPRMLGLAVFAAIQSEYSW